MLLSRHMSRRRPTRADHVSNARRIQLRDLVISLLLAALAASATVAVHRWAYHPAALAEDHIKSLFQGFYGVEGEQPQLYRWTNGRGTICLPAAGQRRPALVLQFALLSHSHELGIRSFFMEVGETRLHLPVLPGDRHYQILLPAAPDHGPVCVTLASATAASPSDDRKLGLAVQSVQIWPLEPVFLPPLDQLALNVTLALCIYWLLRRLGVTGALAGGMVAGVALIVTAGLLGMRLRMAADLPAWSLGATVAVAALLIVDLTRAGPMKTIRPAWLREFSGVLLNALLLAAAWLGVKALSGESWPFPLMARLGPKFSWLVILPLLLFGAWVVFIRWMLGRESPPAWLSIASCWLAACLLPITLKASIRGWNSLFQTFTWQPEDYIRDVGRVGDDPLHFLQTFVAQMPDLALHNHNHPPGATLLLWAFARLFGSGPVPATWSAIALAGLAVWPTYRLAARIGGARVGLLAAAICAVLPAHLIFSTASMDAVFATILAFAIDAIHAALMPGARVWRALAAGAWLALGMCFSFITLMLGFYAAVLLIWRIFQVYPAERGIDATQHNLFRQPLPTALVIYAIMGLLLVMLRWLTGFDIVAALIQGTAVNYDALHQQLPPAGPAFYLFFLAVNSVAYACYLGPWVLDRVAVSGRAGLAALQRGQASSAQALAASLVVLLLGMLFSGLFTREVERIWSFTHILVAAVVAYSIIAEARDTHWLRTAGLMLGTLFLQGVVFRMVFSIYW
jgi:Dolichyl-phosphate-mannose-protein mannosyltransferase